MNTAAADPVALAEVLRLAHHCVLGPDDLALRRELALELVKTSFRTVRRSDRELRAVQAGADQEQPADAAVAALNQLFCESFR